MNGRNALASLFVSRAERIRAAIAVLFLFVPTSLALAAKPPGWLPVAVESALADQLAERFGLLRKGGSQEQDDRDEAAAFTRSLRDVVAGWGVHGALDKAPSFPDLALPPLDDRYLDAMQRYSICNLLLLRQIVHPDFAEDFNARFTGTLGLTGLSLAILRLREPFIAAGGTDEKIEQAMTRPALEAAGQLIQSDDAARAAAEAACQPVLLKILEQPMRDFSARHR